MPANAGDVGLIPGLGRSPGEGNGHPVQNSCLGNSMDRGGWQAPVHGVAKTWTCLSDWTGMHSYTYEDHEFTPVSLVQIHHNQLHASFLIPMYLTPCPVMRNPVSILHMFTSVLSFHVCLRPSIWTPTTLLPDLSAWSPTPSNTSNKCKRKGSQPTQSSLSKPPPHKTDFSEDTLLHPQGNNTRSPSVGPTTPQPAACGGRCSPSKPPNTRKLVSTEKSLPGRGRH